MKLLGTSEYAERHGISVFTVRAMRREGRLPGVTFGGRKLIPEDAVPAAPGEKYVAPDPVDDKMVEAEASMEGAKVDRDDLEKRAAEVEARVSEADERLSEAKHLVKQVSELGVELGETCRRLEEREAELRSLAQEYEKKSASVVQFVKGKEDRLKADAELFCMMAQRYIDADKRDKPGMLVSMQKFVSDRFPAPSGK